MATPPRAAIQSGDSGTLLEIIPTTRSTDDVERVMAQTPEQPDRVDRARLLRLAPTAPPCDQATTCATGMTVLGTPHSPTENRGLVDGSSPRVHTTERRETRQCAAARECRFARNGFRRAANGPDARSSPMHSFLVRVIDVLRFVRPSNVTA